MQDRTVGVLSPEVVSLRQLAGRQEVLERGFGGFSTGGARAQNQRDSLWPPSPTKRCQLRIEIENQLLGDARQARRPGAELCVEAR